VSTARRAVLVLSLATGRKLALLVVADVLILLGALVSVLSGDEPDSCYGLALGTILLLGLPVLSDAVALERRSGSLDLALSSPGASFYFERRVGSVLAVLWLQGSLVVGFWRLIVAPFPVIPVIGQLAAATLFVGAASLFWAVRLKGSSGVLLATALTCVAASTWLFGNPVSLDDRGDFFLTGHVASAWGRRVLGLLLASAVLHAYARRRLARPESVIS
jgi:hypothetical protein